MAAAEARALDEPYTRVMGDLAIRVYPDRRPGNLEIAGIHKAVVLARDGVELVEEGAGFGLPVAKYADKTLFPGSATLRIRDGTHPTVIKTYTMDTVSVKRIRNSRVSDALYHPLHSAFSRLYLTFGGLRPAFDKVIELRNTAGVRTTFEGIEPRGKVEVKYTFHPNHIEIEAVTRLQSGCEELIMLNEQGASTFRCYSDGWSTLVDGRMGAWDRIDYHQATLSDLGGRISFTVDRPSGAGFWRGRESVPGRLSWAGLALSFREADRIRYTVHIEAK